MKHNLDQLFKTNLNQEVAPPEIIWSNIERELLKKKSRKIVPLWQKIAAIAAILLIGFVIGNDYWAQKNTTIQQNNNQVVDKNLKNRQTKNPSDNYNAYLDSDKKVATIDDKIQISGPNKQVNNNVSNDSILKTQILLSQKNNINKPLQFNKIKSRLAQIISSKKLKLSKKQSDNLVLNTNNSLVTALSDSVKSQAVAILQTTNSSNPNNQTTSNQNKTSDFAYNSTIKKDSVVIKPNALEILLTSKNIKKPSEKSTKKWQIVPNLAPLYFNSTTSNSPIDPKLNNNDKTFDNNISFGIGVNYAINKKISVRTGINKFSVGYNTNQIGYYNTNLPTTSANSTQAATHSDDVLVSSTYNTVLLASPNSDLQTNSAGLSGNSTFEIKEGTLTQNTSYIEMPLEISYNIINKKVAVNIIAGMSSLFLINNQTTIKTNNTVLDFGQSNNLSQIHYSTNIGFGFNYKFAKLFKINIEPILKYQINTFDNNVGDYKPYFIGVYSGISYQF